MCPKAPKRVLGFLGEGFGFGGLGFGVSLVFGSMKSMF